MNIRMITIHSVFAAAWTISAAMFAADEYAPLTNPLRDSNRNPATEAANPRSPPDLWRNPSLLRSADLLPNPGAERSPHAAPPSATPPAGDGGQPPAARPPRTLIQRIRERRLAQLEKQAARLRQLSAAEDRQVPTDRGSGNPNGPENPDLQIDLGVAVDAPGPPATAPSPPVAPAASPGRSPLWPPAVPAPSAVLPPAELNPPAASPLEVNIDLPDDVQTPQPKPALQSRVHNWWSSPSPR